jgi:hypothetical protein
VTEERARTRQNTTEPHQLTNIQSRLLNTSETFLNFFNLMLALALLDSDFFAAAAPVLLVSSFLNGFYLSFQPARPANVSDLAL